MKAFFAVLFFLTIHGVVKDPNGAPVAGAVVTIDAARAVTDASGAFALEGAPAGTLRVTRAVCIYVAVDAEGKPIPVKQDKS